VNCDLVDRALSNRLPLNMEMFLRGKEELKDRPDKDIAEDEVINDTEGNIVPDVNNDFESNTVHGINEDELLNTLPNVINEGQLLNLDIQDEEANALLNKIIIIAGLVHGETQE